MALKAEAFQPQKAPIEEVEEAVPFIIPMFLWDVLVELSKIEKCSPGEILDRAVCQYLEANDGERIKVLKTCINQRQSIAQDGGH